MGETGWIIYGIVIIPFIVMAILLLNGKGAFLIAGYNMKSKEEKAKYDEKALCRFVGWLLLAVVLWIILIALAVHFQIPGGSGIFTTIMLVGIVGSIIYANTGNRFHKKVDSETISVADKNEEEKPPTATRAKIYIAIVAITVIALGIMFYAGESEPAVNINSDSIQITGWYGLGVNFTDITDISLVENNMNTIGIVIRTNGYGGIGTLKGNFQSRNHGGVLLFVKPSASPTIHIERNGAKDIFVSFRDSEKTRSLFNEMIRAFSSR